MKLPTRGKIVLLLFVITTLLATSFQPALAGPPEPNNAIPDGEWEGTLAASYLFDFNGVDSGNWDWTGDMHFFSTAGELTGDASISGTGSSENDLAMAIATMNAQVAITGSSFEPLFQAVGGSFDITASASGFTTNVNIPISPADTTPVRVGLTSVTCSQVSGNWDNFVNEFAAANGFTVSNLSTLFAAVRTADLAPQGQTSYQNELADLMNQANDFLKDVKTNLIMDPNKFESLLTKAEELAISLRKNNDCGFTQEWSFALPIANVVAQLIDFAYNNPGYFTNNDMFLLAEAAIRTGLIGAGAVNDTLAKDMNSKLGAIIGVKMDEMDKAGGNCQALMPLFIASNWIGGPTQAQALSLLTKYGCS